MKIPSAKIDNARVTELHVNNIIDELQGIGADIQNIVLNFLNDVSDFINGRKDLKIGDILTSPYRCIKELYTYLKENFVKYSKILILLIEILSLSYLGVRLKQAYSNYNKVINSRGVSEEDVTNVKWMFSLIGVNVITTQILGIMETKIYLQTAEDKDSIFGKALNEINEIRKKFWDDIKKGIVHILNFETLKNMIYLLAIQYKIQFQIAQENMPYAIVLFIDWFTAIGVYYIVLKIFYKYRHNLKWS